MAKIQIKSEKLTPFGGIFSIMEKFDSMLSPVIDSTLGQRCSSIFGYQFSEIVRFADERLFLWRLMRGRCNVTTDAPSRIILTPSYMQPDTILRAIKELTQKNISYTSRPRQDL